MTESDQIDAFDNELSALIGRFINEFDLTTAAAIGVLEIKKHDLIAHALKNRDNTED